MKHAIAALLADIVHHIPDGTDSMDSMKISDLSQFASDVYDTIKTQKSKVFEYLQDIIKETEDDEEKQTNMIHSSVLFLKSLSDDGDETAKECLDKIMKISCDES